MATLAAGAPTTFGDGTHAVDLWAGAIASTLRLAAGVRSLLAPAGYTLNAFDLWASAPPASLRLSPGACNLMAPDVFDIIGGYVFVVSAATLSPQLPRSTRFPAAQ